jgi:uncharacterized protein YdeI (YjbR/CyaY-like superfamily)
MGKKDKKVDAYIAKSAEFAKPILSYLRDLVHKACSGVEEKIKWGFSQLRLQRCHVQYGRVQATLFDFWKASLMNHPSKILSVTDRNSMGHFDRITSLKDLPSDKILVAYIKHSAELNEMGIKRRVKTTPRGSKTIDTPDYFKKVLKKNKTAHEVFENFAYSHRKEYIQWFEEAKTDETRNNRMAQAIGWISEGKGRNWKYEKK